MDLQLAYMAAPASAAVASSAQQAPAAAQQAAQAAFAAQIEQREESVNETPDVEGAKIRPDAERRGDAGTYSPRKRRRFYQAETESPDAIEVEPADERHFIDTTA